jgi:hypothetical protein
VAGILFLLGSQIIEFKHPIAEEALIPAIVTGIFYSIFEYPVG